MVFFEAGTGAIDHVDCNFKETFNLASISEPALARTLLISSESIQSCHLTLMNAKASRMYHTDSIRQTPQCVYLVHVVPYGTLKFQRLYYF